MERKRTIAVVGAGIGGLAAATALAQAGHAVRVLEQSETLGEVGAGLQIGPNGLKVLDRLGLGQAALNLATRPEAVSMRDGLAGAEIAQVRFGQHSQNRYGAPMAQLHRADLVALLETAARDAGAEILLARSADPAAPPDADVVVAADGVRSRFRHRMFPGTAARFTGQIAWRALVPAARMPGGMDQGQTWLCLGPGRHLVLYALRGGAVWNLVAVEERDTWAEEGWSHRGEPGALLAAFAGWTPEVRAVLGAAEDVIRWGLFDHPALPRWHEGNTALLGDACHAMLPFLAQGATMALEDAWVLRDCLAGGGDVESALARYSDRRLARATRVQRAAVRNARIYHLQGAPLRLARNTGLRAIDRFAPGGLLGQFDWLYGTDVTADAG
ncbi:FAD-dependent monooxygenase [Oceanibium sediminis]|uniref:FAD-dependent monooxygenase n=1 Tax=Oceanibium sediminis TaxID=2026339 RepID=UPI000DD2E234|nr:FAD-dependent monooxygenase [Oceanibium sediminis]